uniref:CWH43-like N-terminal domain-containing protein n=2 Tax=Caenorhabditis japonica TaxID=281687 RepID=A0A8R1HIX0_CAEJA
MAFGDDDIISIPFRYFVFCIGALPSSALLICVCISVLYHFEQSTSTHCEVPNWLPSISAAVSTQAPEKYIWRILIGLHIGPRLALSVAFRNFLLSSPLRQLSGSKQFRVLCNVACVLNLLENFFLLALTSISSTEDHTLHAKCFGGFAICSIIYMVLSTWLFSESGRRRATNLGERSYEYKILGAAMFIVCFALGGYLYWRHNTYCEPGIYTLFALVEYSAVLSNIFFHCTVYYDFHGKCIALTSSFGGVNYSPLPTRIEKDT